MGDATAYAISVWAPWAWAILHAGKDIENRSNGKRRFPRNVLGRVWLHASLWPGTRLPLTPAKQHELADEFRSAVERSGKPRESFGVVTLRQLDSMRGKIVGSVCVTGYTTESDSRWFVPGSIGIELAEPIALADPVEALGALGWWRVPPPVLALLPSQAAASIGRAGA